MSKHTQFFLATFLLFLCKKDDKKHFSERFFYGELNTESTEKTKSAQKGRREEH
jgi:hypothetical protein